jgi:RecB family exonuclease
MPLPTARERRLAMRLRASELVGMLEAADPAYPETPAARERLAARLAEVGTSAALDADQVRAAGLDPLTFRTVALDTGSGANLLKVAPLPPTFSYTSLSAYEECGLRYSFKYVYRIPSPDRPRAAASFGSTAHAAFETFTKERRERLARGEEAPNREDLERLFKANWKPTEFGDQTTEARFAKKITNLLDNFYTGEIESRATVLHEELKFTLVLDPGDGSAPVRIGGSIDRIDRLESGGIEVLDYKTGKVESQKDVDTNLQVTIYALVVRDTLRLGTPEKVTLYFTEASDRRSTVRTDEQLDLARQELLDRVRPIRAGEFTANPGDACKWCDYTAICSERKLRKW